MKLVKAQKAEAEAQEKAKADAALKNAMRVPAGKEGSYVLKKPLRKTGSDAVPTAQLTVAEVRTLPNLCGCRARRFLSNQGALYSHTYFYWDCGATLQDFYAADTLPGDDDGYLDVDDTVEF